MDEILKRMPEDGTLAWGNLTPKGYRPKTNLNIMIIETPEHLRVPGEPVMHLATEDRSIPGEDYSGNAILDKMFPNLPKVMTYEDALPERLRDDSPPPKHSTKERKEFERPLRTSSPSGVKSRPYSYKKPVPETSSRRKAADEISPWLPGNEPYIPHGSLQTIPLIAKSGPQRMDYVPHRENQPQEYTQNPSNFVEGLPPAFSAGFDDGPPVHFPGGFVNEPPPNYSGGLGDGTEPKFQSNNGFFHPPKFGTSVRRPFRSRNSRGGRPSNNAFQEESRDDDNLNQRFQSENNFRKNNYPNSGHYHAPRRPFEDEERSSAAQPWVANERSGPMIMRSYGTGRQRANRRFPRKHFNRRGKQNY